MRIVTGVVLVAQAVLLPQTPPRPPGGVPTGAPIVSTFEAAMITSPPAALGLDPFYKKYADAFGIPVVSSEKVDNAALLMARDIVNGTTKARVQSPDDLKAYDPAIYGILDRIYAGHRIPADVYYGKNLRPAAKPAGSSR